MWSDMRRHWLLPTRRARINERRLSAACGVTRLTDCASMLFPLHVCHTRYTCVHVAACFMRTSPLNSQFPPPCAHPHPQSRSPHIQPTPPTQSLPCDSPPQRNRPNFDSCDSCPNQLRGSPSQQPERARTCRFACVKA